MMNTDNPKNTSQLIFFGIIQKILFNHNNQRHPRSISLTAE